MKQQERILANFKAKQIQHSQPNILQRMLPQLTPKLTTLDKHDPSIALIDAWAAVLSVLHFYQQQYNQENYLNSAAELRSLCELAHSIGYKLRPAIAASTMLAFTVEANANGTGVASVPKGTKVQSVPSNGELPQTFETSNDLVARAEWNQLKPYQTQQVIWPTITASTTSVDIAGVTNGVSVGDRLVISGINAKTEKPVYYAVKATDVQSDHKAGKTTVSWQSGWCDANDDIMLQLPQLFIFRKKVACFGNNAPLFVTMPDAINASYPNDDNKNKIGWDENKPNVWQDSHAKDHDDQVTDPTKKRSLVYLDQVLSKIKADSMTLLVNDTEQKLYKVIDTSEAFIVDFGLSGRVTILNLTDKLTANTDITNDNGPATNDKQFNFRTTTIYTESELLPLYTETITKNELLTETIVLDKPITLLPTDRSIVLSVTAKSTSEKLPVTAVSTNDNPPQIILDKMPIHKYVPGTLNVLGVGFTKPIAAVYSDELNALTLAENLPNINNLTEIQLTGSLEPYSEVAEIENCKINADGLTELTLKVKPKNIFTTVNTSIFANVVAATHGETVNEVLGSGNTNQRNQQFSLKKTPLTYLTAPTAKGVQSTLAITVNDKIYWHEADNFFALTPTDRRYVIQRTTDDQTTILFGDGKHGAHLPNGQENVKATYRYGAGKLGNVSTNALTLLQTRPQGVTAVTNPLSASGGVDAETIEEIRTSAPLHLQTLERIVSLQDYVNFVQAYAGIRKVQANLFRFMHVPTLLITVAGNAGAAVTPDTLLYQNLTKAIAAVSVTSTTVFLQSYEAKFFNLAATIKINPDYRATELKQEIETTLLTYFSFDQRNLAQSVSAAEVMQLIQAIPGVMNMQLELLYLQDSPPSFNTLLKANPAQLQQNKTFQCCAAQLITINPLGIALKVKS